LVSVQCCTSHTRDTRKCYETIGTKSNVAIGYGGNIVTLSLNIIGYINTTGSGSLNNANMSTFYNVMYDFENITPVGGFSI